MGSRQPWFGNEEPGRMPLSFARCWLTLRSQSKARPKSKGIACSLYSCWPCAASSRNSALPRSKVLADCGRKAYSWFRWKRDKMEKCVRKDAKISAPCTKCFSEAGQYGHNHCKSQCLFGDRCSERCLGCTGKHDVATAACVGAQKTSFARAWNSVRQGSAQQCVGIDVVVHSWAPATRVRHLLLSHMCSVSGKRRACAQLGACHQSK